MKFMTFNIWNYGRSWAKRRQIIAGIIDTHQPDVVALQETRHDFRFERGEGQAEQIARLTRYHATWAVGQVYLPLLRVDEGLTILTREAPARVMQRRLTQYPRERGDRNQRICLGVEVSHGGRRVGVYNTHFSLSEVARISNAREVARFVAEQSPDQPTVLMGDLNAEPDAPPIRYLTGEQTLEGESAGFVDCWVAANPEQPGFTYASFRPVRRIDYVLGRNLPAGVRGASLIGGEAVDGVYPSDHLGIVVELDV